MKLIIDIDEELYKAYKGRPPMLGDSGMDMIVRAVANGIPYEERPQGEWIKEPNGRTTDIYRCSICGRSILLCKGADLSKYPFCNCGAKMKGGAV